MGIQSSCCDIKLVGIVVVLCVNILALMSAYGRYFRYLKAQYPDIWRDLTERDLIARAIGRWPRYPHVSQYLVMSLYDRKMLAGDPKIRHLKTLALLATVLGGICVLLLMLTLLYRDWTH